VSSSGPSAPRSLATHQDGMPAAHRKVLQALRACRTDACGVTGYACSECGEVHRIFRSCGNRHCPQCQHHKSRAWLNTRRQRAPPRPPLPPPLHRARSPAPLHAQPPAGRLCRPLPGLCRGDQDPRPRCTAHRRGPPRLLRRPAHLGTAAHGPIPPSTPGSPAAPSPLAMGPGTPPGWTSTCRSRP
jgi:hypothetical protein